MPLPLSIELDTMLRLVICGLVLFYLWPRYVFAVDGDVARADRLAGYAARMLLLVAGAALGLAAVHAFSWFTLAVLVFAPRLLKVQPDTGQGRGVGVGSRLLGDLDRLGSLPRRAWAFLRKGLQGPWRVTWRPSVYVLAGGFLLAVLLGVSAYLRLAPAFAHAGIAFSDSNVVLYWVQAIGQQILFPNGIYPEGFHAAVAGLMRLSVASPIATIKFIGPIIGVAMVGSVGFAAYRLTGRFAPAAVAMLVYGTLPHLLPYIYLRQAGTDSQEFGNMLVLPTLWFVYASWVKQGNWYRGTAIALLAMAALTHPIVSLNAGLAAVAATVAAWLTVGVRWQTLGWWLRWLPVALVLAVAPLVVALAIGIPLNTASVGFAAQTTAAAAPPITTLDKLALLSACMLLLVRAVRLVARRAERADLGMPLAALLTLVAALAIQEAATFGIHLLALQSRSGEFVALAVALCLGMSVSAVQELLELVRPAFGRWAGLLLAAGVVAGAWAQSAPQPFNPFPTYRWLPDDFVVAYARIAATQPSGSWLAVSDDSGFDYAYGQGLFMTAADFAQHVGTKGPWPTYHHPGQATRPLATRHLFIFVDRRIVVAPSYSTPTVPRRQAVQKLIRGWVNRWERTHGPLHVYFRGPDLTVYELTAPGWGSS